MAGICPFLAAAARIKENEVEEVDIQCFPECEIYDEVKHTCSMKSATIRLHYLLKGLKEIQV